MSIVLGAVNMYILYCLSPFFYTGQIRILLRAYYFAIVKNTTDFFFSFPSDHGTVRNCLNILTEFYFSAPQ